MDRLEEIEARAEKATPGQWRLWSRGEPITDPAWAAGKVGCCGIGPFDKPVISQWAGYGYISPADEDFLLYAREDIPWLVDQLRAARAEAERMREALAKFAAFDCAFATHEGEIHCPDDEGRFCSSCDARNALSASVPEKERAK